MSRLLSFGFARPARLASALEARPAAGRFAELQKQAEHRRRLQCLALAGTSVAFCALLLGAPTLGLVVWIAAIAPLAI